MSLETSLEFSLLKTTVGHLPKNYYPKFIFFLKRTVKNMFEFKFSEL
jgi:hypothetical protein